MKYRYLGFWGMIFASCGGGDEGDLIQWEVMVFWALTIQIFV